MSLLDPLFNHYADFKHKLEGHGLSLPNTLIGKVYNGMSSVCGTLTYELAPLLNSRTTGKVYTFIRDHFSKATAAFAMSSYYDSSWLANAGLSALTVSLDQEFTIKKMHLARDVATGLLLLHTIKAANNVVSFVSSPNLPDAIGCIFDAASVVYASQLIQTNEYQKRAPQKAD